MRPQAVVLFSQKKFQIFEKNFFEKKDLPAYLCGHDLENRVRKYF